MATRTPNLSLIKPGPDDAVDVADLNENFDKIDIFAGGVGGDTYTKSEIDEMLAEKVDAEEGKGLSTNDFTNQDKEQITINENNIALRAMYKVYSSVRNTSTSHEYTMKKTDFNGSPAGIYLIFLVTWSTTPSFSLYAVSYSGNQTTVTNVTKIAGADANVSVTDDVISCTTSGKIQIIAVQ